MNRGLLFSSRSRGYRGSSHPRGDADCRAGARGGKSVFLKFLGSFKGAPLNRDAILGRYCFDDLLGASVTQADIKADRTNCRLWYLRLYGVMVGATIPAEHHKSGSLSAAFHDNERFSTWTMADLCFMAITGKKPPAEEAPSTANPCRSADFKRSRRDLLHKEPRELLPPTWSADSSTRPDK